MENPKSFQRYCNICKIEFTKKQVKEEKLGFFCVPDGARRKRWIESSGVDLVVDARVCSKHFKLSDFINPPGTQAKKHKLMPGAIPIPVPGCSEDNSFKFCDQLKETLDSLASFHTKIAECNNYEKMLSAHYNNITTTTVKHFCVYLLMEPTNLHGRDLESIDKVLTWKSFLNKIFYVGQGELFCPYMHLKVALKTFSSYVEVDKRTKRIQNIWASGRGVVCVRFCCDITSNNSKTRQAAMIDALTLTHLTNTQPGTYFEPTQNWTAAEKKCLGIALLHKAMQILLLQGESPLRPGDLQNTEKSSIHTSNSFPISNERRTITKAKQKKKMIKIDE